MPAEMNRLWRFDREAHRQTPELECDGKPETISAVSHVRLLSETPGVTAPGVSAFGKQNF